MAAEELSTEDEAACRRLVVAFAQHVDHREFEKAAALFADDGVWERHGQRLTGRESILALLLDRPETTVERHVMTTIRITRLSAVECAGTSYVMIFRAQAEPGTVPTLAGPSGIGEFHDRFRLTEDGWRFSYRTTVPAFKVEPAPPTA